MKSGNVVIFLTVLLLAGCQMGKDEKTAKEKKKSGASTEAELVRTAMTERGRLLAKLAITARVEALEQTEILPKVEGTVVEVFADEGDDVTQGQLLAKIESDEAQIRVAAQVLAVEQADLAISMAKISRDETKSVYKAFETTLAKERNERERALAQHAKGAISDKDRDAAVFVYNKALADKEQAALKAKKAEEEVLNASIQKRTATNTLDAEKLKLSFTELRATIAGKLIKRYLRVGQKATLGQSAFKIADLSSLVVRARIPETDLRVLKQGLRVVLSATAFPGVQYRGTVDLIASEIDTDGGQVDVRIKLEPGEPPLRPGMFVSGHIVTEEREGSLLIPRKALLFDRDRPYIYVVDHVGDKRCAKKVYLRRGLQNATHVEYLPMAGEDAKIDDRSEIVIVGLDRLTDGGAIEIEGENVEGGQGGNGKNDKSTKSATE